MNHLNLCLPEFLRASSVSTFPNHINPTYGQKRGTRINEFTLPMFIGQLEISAVEQSWEREFSGDAAQALWKHVVEHYDRQHRVYAHYTAIVQSSGMGKSRTVDELGKTHFVMPINLRGSHSTGAVSPVHVDANYLRSPITFRVSSC